jgi:hypothetical protein
LNERLQRLLIVATPMVAMTTVALGLRFGAGEAVRAAVVYGAPGSHAGTGLAWQLVVFDEERRLREPAAHLDVQVQARGPTGDATWQGRTNEDGVAEVLLPLDGPAVHLEVRAGPTPLASGDAQAALEMPGIPAPEGDAPWARFARREGAVVLDVAVFGQRVATGFPAHLWVRATDAARTPLAGVAIEPEAETSFVPATPTSVTDARGWAHVVATPVGHAVDVELKARTPDGRSGQWVGSLYISPGAAQLAMDERVPPDQEPVIDVVVPTSRTTAYLEIDDRYGRAWAAAAPVAGAAGQLPRATVRAPRLAPGLYWAVCADDPSGAASLGPGTIARPFFVAATDEAALAFGMDAAACAPPSDARDATRVVSECLALAAAVPAPRSTALEGFTMQHERDARRKSGGLGLALGGILVAILLEGLLLLRVARASRATLREASEEAGEAPARLQSRAWTVGIGVLIALMGLALAGAFVLRLA